MRCDRILLKLLHKDFLIQYSPGVSQEIWFVGEDFMSTETSATARRRGKEAAISAPDNIDRVEGKVEETLTISSDSKPQEVGGIERKFHDGRGLDCNFNVVNYAFCVICRY